MSAPIATPSPWTLARVIAWIEQLEAGFDQLSLFDLLEIPPTASLAHVRQAFHAIAVSRHPDVWRNRMTPIQLDRLVRAYGRVAAAYATLRDPDERTRYLRTTRDSQPGLTRPAERTSRDSQPALSRPPERAARDSQPVVTADRAARDSRPPVIAAPPATMRPAPITAPPRSASPTAPPRPASGTVPPTASAALGPRAQSYYRRAEAAARLGDIAAAVLNLRLAIAAEPTSVFLRNALTAAQAELKK
jgi:curved DNA-binding protein CbpA